MNEILIYNIVRNHMYCSHSVGVAWDRKTQVIFNARVINIRAILIRTRN